MKKCILKLQCYFKLALEVYHCSIWIQKMKPKRLNTNIMLLILIHKSQVLAQAFYIIIQGMIKLIRRPSFINLTCILPSGLLSFIICFILLWINQIEKTCSWLHFTLCLKNIQTRPFFFLLVSPFKHCKKNNQSYTKQTSIKMKKNIGNLTFKNMHMWLLSFKSLWITIERSTYTVVRENSAV